MAPHRFYNSAHEILDTNFTNFYESMWRVNTRLGCSRLAIWHYV
jgi:hypothetical protein